MTLAAAAFLLIATGFLVTVPRRYALIPLLMAVAYTTRLPVIEIGPANLSVLRVLVIVGILRTLARGERIAHGLNAVDRLLFLWAGLLIGLSVFHTSDAWTFRIGLVLGELGFYWLCRIFVQDAGDIHRMFRVLSVALLPLAALMLMEKFASHNYFEVMGQFSEVNIRDGHVRAFGPFAHPILAGTAGASLAPMAMFLWRSNRLIALSGLCAAMGIVLASTSSGPVMMVLFTCLGMLVWNVRTSLRLIRWGTVAMLLCLQVVMKDPVYFLMARIDITGSSTGWHRAQLIRSSLEHLGEWWAVGTDYTRHWMASGVHSNTIHTDITNHFLGMGVNGGLPLLIAFVLVLRAGFRQTGAALRADGGESQKQAFLTWTLGAMLFGQVVNFWSISLFDQSVSFFYLVLAMIGALELQAAAAMELVPDVVPAAASVPLRLRPAAPALGRFAVPRAKPEGLGAERSRAHTRIRPLGNRLGGTRT